MYLRHNRYVVCTFNLQQPYTNFSLELWGELMTASQNHKYNQLKWLYSALSGFCAAYFLALFSGSQGLGKFDYLFISTLLFSICLPIFTSFAIAHVYMSEAELSVEQCDKAINSKWVSILTIGSFVLLFGAVTFLIGFFSTWLMFSFFITSGACFGLFIVFIRQLHPSINKNVQQESTV